MEFVVQNTSQMGLVCDEAEKCVLEGIRGDEEGNDDLGAQGASTWSPEIADPKGL